MSIDLSKKSIGFSLYIKYELKEMNTMKITPNMVATAYKYAIMSYKGQISKQDAEFKINKESGMSIGSAQAYITILEGMLRGTEFHRTMNMDSFKYYLESIRRDFGEESFKKALNATKEHTKYYAALGHGSLKSVESIIEEMQKTI